ncbi:hypothetical protein BDV28DRAFT_3711 [Aspergillus coremiiformis]|uniref:Small secreted protein n=1 Tax=Aspergillus coremiiformis TaxID=138285 RepID=A0A5N6Z5F9_9EURO|nr:hypothetical protein BDV28DRAFT_3711 [Aspergillus coremiiformis]
MFSSTLITLAALLGMLTTDVTANATTLNVTVIAAQNNQSTLECWALEPGFTSSTQSGTSGNPVLSLGIGAKNMSYIMIPAHTDGGKHNAPTMQWVAFLSGVAHITLPHSDDEAWIQGGENGTILAIDTADVSAEGHFTVYPSDEVTVALSLPISKVPGHRVLHRGACLYGTEREQND